MGRPGHNIVSFKSQWNALHATCRLYTHWILLHIAVGCTGFQLCCDLQHVSLMLSICLQGWIDVSDRRNLVVVRYKLCILRAKQCLVMYISIHPWDLKWHRRYTSSNDVRLAMLFPMFWWSKHRFWFVQVDSADQPQHKTHGLPPCGPYLATYNISPINKVKTKYTCQCSEIEPFATTSRPIRQIDTALHPMKSWRNWRQVQLSSRNGPRQRRITQHEF